LFNRIVGRRIAIVHDEAGVTRDRVSAEAEWRGRPFTLVDTGGIGLERGEKTDDVMTRETVGQVDVAIEAADAIIFVVDVQQGIVPLDREVAFRLREAGRPVIVAVNKVDTSKAAPGVDEFAELGFDQIYPISAIHGRHIEPLVKAAFDRLPARTESSASDEEGDLDNAENRFSNICIVGRPNVGKSSIVNALTQSDRVIVSDIPGTTRDAVDVPFEVETDGVRQKYTLIDTAGVRKKRRVDNTIEFFSVKRTESAIERSDIVVLVIDAEAGVTMQDKKIADKITEERKACILVVNKWDLVGDAVTEARKEQIAERKQKKRRGPDTQPEATLAEFGEWVQGKMFFLSYAPVIFTSAKSGFHLDRLLESIRYVGAQLRQRIPTALLNRTLRDAMEKHPAPTEGNARLKFYYATQTDDAPPTILMFVNRKDLFTKDYARFIEKSLRKAFGFEGCPVLIVAKPRPKKVESIRRANPKAKKKPASKNHPAMKKAAPKKGGKGKERPSRGKRGVGRKK